ncbi:MAG: ABC transporter permease subunit [Mycoplasma sp.]
MKNLKKFFSASYMLIILLVIYIPIIVMIILAFNNNGSISSFIDYSFGFKYFGAFFRSVAFWKIILNTIAIAVISTLIATIIGTLAAVSLWRTSKRISNFVLTINNIPLINADILTATALLIFFLGMFLPFGFFSLVCAHVSFCVPYVLLTVLTRIKNIDANIIDSSYDLGATPMTTLRKVILPIIRPGIYIGAAIAFSMSFDDFIISYFTSGNVQNISIYLYTQKSLTPIVNVFFIFILILLVVGLLVINFAKNFLKKKNILIKALVKMNQRIIMAELSNRSNKEQTIKKLQADRDKLEAKISKESFFSKNLSVKNSRLAILNSARTKRFLNLGGVIALLFGGTGFLIYYFEQAANELDLAIYGSYIDDDTYNSFNDKTGIFPNVTTFTNSEQMGAKLLTHNYDLIMESDYYVTKLLDKDNNYANPKLQKIDFTKLAKYMNMYGGTNYSAADVKNGFNSELLQKVPSITDNLKPSDNFNDTYLLPYNWGTLMMLDKNSSSYQPNFDSIWNAIKNHERIVLSDDSRNTFWFIFQLMLSAESNGEKQLLSSANINNPTPDNKEILDSITHDGENAVSANAIHSAANFFKQVLKIDDNISFQGDGIQDVIGSGKYDIAIVYSSDLLFAVDKYPSLRPLITNLANAKLITNSTTNPYNGFNGNLWIDGFSLLKSESGKNLENSYKFLGYIYSKKQYTYLMDYCNGLPVFDQSKPAWSITIDPNKFPTEKNTLSDEILHMDLKWPDASLYPNQKGYSIYIYAFSDVYVEEYNTILADISG